MNDNLKSAVILSIISAPSKLGLWDTLSDHPAKIFNKLNSQDLKVQEIIDQNYSKNPFKASDMIIERCFKRNAEIITIWDERYPQLLKEIHNPPLVLYVMGKLTSDKKISVVGTRDSDEKSETITERISHTASQMGYTIVSGMALGIDRSAHLGALLAGGSTVAVLPGGVDMIYPYKNSDLYWMIAGSDNSAIVSEYPPGIGNAQKWTFARRNRIISGLSEAVVVIQAPLKSGAMITARYAIEQNRDLFVCPGNAFDEKYSGCHELIRQGAAVFSDMNDLFPGIKPFYESEKFHHTVKNTAKNYEKQKKERGSSIGIDPPAGITGIVGVRMYEELKNGVIDIDEFIRKNNFSADEVNQEITMLEISGCMSRKGNRLIKT